MPLYFFNLKTRDGTIRDPDGMDLPDESAAVEHARYVARELMQHRKLDARSWRIDICDGEGRSCADLLFASVDDKIGRLPPELRSSVESFYAGSASLFEAINAVKLTVCQVKGTIARSERAPYVATINGVAVDEGTGASAV